MPQLEIRRRSGAIETKELDRRAPVTIGSSSTADVCVDAEGVLAIECRVIWNGQVFVVNSVNPDGVPLNGSNVRKAILDDADVLRVGDVDIIFVGEAESAPAAKGNGVGEVQMKSMDEDEQQDFSGSGTSSRTPQPGRANPVSERSARAAKPARPPERTSPAKSSSSKSGDERPLRSAPATVPVEPVPRADRGDRSDKGDRGDRTSRGGGGGGGRSGEDRPKKPLYDILDDADDSPPPRPVPQESSRATIDPIAQVLADVDTQEKRDKPVLARGGGTVGPVTPEKTQLRETINSILHPPKKRPGEQELHRSPLVIGLGIGALVLLLTSGTLWFVLSREFMNRAFDAAEAQLNAGQYEEAVESFSQFVNNYPRSDRAKDAKVFMGKAKVEKSLTGAIPDWEAGLKTLNEFVNEHRDSKEFQPGDSILRAFARTSADRIAMGATETAKTAKRRPLLTVATDAKTLLELLSVDEKPTEKLAAISESARAAESAILQHETFESAAARMKAATAEGNPLSALKSYRELLDRYAVARTDKPIQTQLRQALDAEQKGVRRADSHSAAANPAEAAPTPSALSLARRVRSRTDVASVGATTFALASGSLFGVDSITGDLLWRRPIGVNTPFQPISVQSTSPGVLAYDDDRKELVCVKERGGEVIWRTQFTDRPTGPPLVHEGQLFFATDGATLTQFDLSTGEFIADLKFSQPVIGPPAVSPAGDRMYLLGRESLLYVLSRRPLGCEKAVWLGHGAGVIRAPLMMLRDYLLMVENAGGDRSIVRLLDTSRDPKAPREIASADMEGQVYDAPVVRGKQIVIPSSPERLTAFVVAETGDSKSLTKIASYQVPSGQPSPMHVLLGPDDQFWMSSTSLRRFDVKVDSILPDKQQVALGQTSQPLVAAGESLFLGRRPTYSRAVLLASADRQKMLLDWQTGLGATILETTEPSASDGTALVATSLGDLFQVNSARLGRGGIELQPTAILPVDDKSTIAVGAVKLKDGRMVVWSGGEAPRLWVVSNDAAPRETKLDLPLQVAPARLNEGLVLPQPGRLRLAARNANSPPVQEWASPVQAAAPPAWRGIAAVGDSSLITLDEAGRVMTVQLRSAPKPHLAEVAHWDSNQTVDRPLAIAGDRPIVVGSNGRVVALDTQSLEPVGQFDLPRPADRPAVVVGGRVLLDAGRQTLYCLDSTARLNKLWELPLDGAGLVGAVETNGRLILARDDGWIQTLDPATGVVRSQLKLSERLAFGPRLWGGRLTVGSLDGTLLSLPLNDGEVASRGENP